MKRRGFLKAVGAAVAVALLPHARSTSAAPLIPAYPVNHPLPAWVNVCDFGAVPDPRFDSGPAVQRAIDHALAARESIVYFPPGVYSIDDHLAVSA